MTLPLFVTIAVKTATTMATAACSKGNQACGPIPTHIGDTDIPWLGSKAPSKADMDVNIKCNNFLHDDIQVKKITYTCINY